MEHERLSFTSEDRFQHLRARSFFAATKGFTARSAADRGLALCPEMTLEKVLEILGGWECLSSESSLRSQEILLKKEDQLLRVALRRGHVAFELLAAGLDAGKDLEGLLARFEPYKFQNKEDDGVWVDFAHLTQAAVARTTQFLRCPAWADIKENYPAAVRESMGSIFRLKRPWRRGRLLLWHGPPGTGKTFAIRSLMMEWKKSFDFMVINDPENLASNPGYYYQVASESADTPGRFRSRAEWRILEGMDLEGEPEEEPESKRKRRLFILEDTADLILEESRSSHFDKIGKLLNMTDGLFGQGREDLFLLTFNEDVGRIDPAFLRPGRCIAKIEFPKFKGAEAAAWLRRSGAADPPGEGDLTLAELYSRLLSGKGDAEVDPPAPSSRRVGFGPA